MTLTSRATILVAVAVVALLVPAVAYGAFSSFTSNPGNSVSAGVLKASGALGLAAHVQNNASNAGDVTLTWNDGLSNTGSLNPTGYVVERQTAGSGNWQTVSTPTLAADCNAGHTCTFTDTTAAFNATYGYRVRSALSSWTAGPTTVRVAASVAPDAAEERVMPTDSLYSVAWSSAGLIAVGQNGRIMVCGSPCTGTGSWQVANSATTNDLYRVAFDGSGSGRTWAVGAAGTVLTCASNCTSTTATWTSVNAGTAESLYGIAATSGYVAVVGTNRTMRYTTRAAFDIWQTGTVSAGTTTTTLYGIAIQGAKNVVLVGSGGVIAACSFTGGGASVCGGSANPLDGVTFTGGTSSAPTGDMRDVAYVTGTGSSDHVYAVGAGGKVYVSTSLTSGYTTKSPAGFTANLNAVAGVSPNVAAAVGEPAASNSSVFLRCTASCAGAGTWSTGPDTGVARSLFGIAGSGSNYWAVGAGGTIRYFNGTSWVSQSAPVTSVAPSVLQTNDTNRYALTTAATLGTACTTPALVASAIVPARSSSAVTTPTVKVTVGYTFGGSTNSSQVSLSTNGGSTWSAGEALTPNVAAPTARTVDLTGTVPASDNAQQILVCVQGAGGGGRMNVDMVHVDVEE